MISAGKPCLSREGQWTLSDTTKFAKSGEVCKKITEKQRKNLEDTSKPIKKILSDKEDQVEKGKHRRSIHEPKKESKR